MAVVSIDAAAPGTAAMPARRRPSYLVVLTMIALMVIGGYFIVSNWGPLAVGFPAATVDDLLLLVATAVPSFLLLRRIRPIVRGPRLPALACVVWGMTAAGGCAMLANAGLGAIWARLLDLDVATDWGASLTAPVNEELLKLAGLVLLVLAAPWLLRGPLDGFCYGTLVGLGFEVVENLVYGLREISISGGTRPGVAVLFSFLLRMGLLGVGSHWALSGIAGAGLGLLIAARREGRSLLPGLALIVAAMALHGVLDAGLDATVPGTFGKALSTGVCAVACYAVFRQRARNRAFTEMAVRQVPLAVLSRRGRRRMRQQAPAGPARQWVVDAQRAELAVLEPIAYTGR